MANRLTVINQLRPKIISQRIVDLKLISRRVSKNTTFNAEEIQYLNANGVNTRVPAS